MSTSLSHENSKGGKDDDVPDPQRKKRGTGRWSHAPYRIFDWRMGNAILARVWELPYSSVARARVRLCQSAAVWDGRARYGHSLTGFKEALGSQEKRAVQWRSSKTPLS